DAPISASAPTPLRKAPEHSPMADSSRLTATWRNRASAAKRAISGVIQPSGRLATSVMPHAAAASATRSATASALLVDFVIRVRSGNRPWLGQISAKHPSENAAMQVCATSTRLARWTSVHAKAFSAQFSVACLQQRIARHCRRTPRRGLAKILGYSHMDQRCHRAFGRRRCAILAAALLLALTRAAAADDVENFYRGRTLTVVISFSVGGGYDLYARVLARYLGKYIPGHPTIVPANMPGAGGLRASNYLYTAAAKDGSVIGTFSR